MISALLTSLTLLPAAWAGPSADALGAGADPGDWAVEARLGVPWQSVTARAGLDSGWTPMVEIETAFSVENHLSVGVGRAWIDGERVRLGGEATAGWFLRSGELARVGPSAALKIRVARAQGVVVPWFSLDTRHTFTRYAETVLTSSGESTTYTGAHYWSPAARGGLAVDLGDHLGLSAGLDWVWMEPPNFPIPGLHVALIAGGAR